MSYCNSTLSVHLFWFTEKTTLNNNADSYVMTVLSGKFKKELFST